MDTQSDRDRYTSCQLHPERDAAPTSDRNADPTPDRDADRASDGNSDAASGRDGNPPPDRNPEPCRYARRHRDSDACAEAPQCDRHVGASHPDTNPEAAFHTDAGGGSRSVRDAAVGLSNEALRVRCVAPLGGMGAGLGSQVRPRE